MNRKLAAIVAASAGTLLAAGLAASQPQTAPSKKEIAAMMQAAGGPVAEHKLLQPLVGRFEGEFSVSMGPGVPPLEMKTAMESTWILGERFVEMHSGPGEGEELPIESRFTLGFDKRTKKYFAFGIDSTDTYPVFAEGGYDEATKTFTLLGENLEPSLGKKLPFKFLFRIESEDKYVSEVWFQMEGAPGADEEGWFRVVQSTQTRVK